jgi:hypothetical protein
MGGVSILKAPGCSELAVWVEDRVVKVSKQPDDNPYIIQYLL